LLSGAGDVGAEQLAEALGNHQVLLPFLDLLACSLKPSRVVLVFCQRLFLGLPVLHQPVGKIRL
jgi:hypothetical protein